MRYFYIIDIVRGECTHDLDEFQICLASAHTPKNECIDCHAASLLSKVIDEAMDDKEENKK